MDFHTLPRKQLQALCKKNKIPANMTNVAMADSLAALDHVEGIEEVWNPVDTDAQKFPDEKGVGTPACRTSTRRKPVIEEPESSKISTRPRRGTRARNDEEIDQENKDLNVPPVTPAVPTTARRRAPAASTSRKKEDEKPADHVPKTPAASNSRVKATSAYNMRKSTRLLEKGLSKMSLMDKEMSEELSSVSQQMEDLEETENGASSLAKSTEVIEETDETESVKVDEIPEEMTDLPQKIEKSEDALEEGANSQTISTEVIEKIDESEFTSSEMNTAFECQSNDSNSEMSLVSEEESDTGASPQAEAQESLIKINESGSPFEDMNNSSGSDIELTKSIAKEVNDANNESGTESMYQIENDAFSVDKQKSNEHTNMGDDNQNSVLMLSSHAENETVVEMEGDSADFAGIHVSEIDDEVDASMVIEDKNEASEHSNVGNDTQNSENNEEAVEIVGDIQEVMISAENKGIETAYDNQNSEETFSAENKVVETSCDIQNSEEMFSAAEKKEVEVEDMGFQTSSGIEELKEYVENDAVMEACNEPTSEGNTNVLSVADSLSLEVNMNAQGVVDSQSPLVRNEAEAESETADVQFSLVSNEAEAESETADVQIGNEEDCKENANVPTVTFAPISSQQKTTEVPVQFSCQDEVKSVIKICDEEGDKQKENQINDDLGSISMRQLRKMLKISLDNKTNNDKINNSVVKDVERKRTALQELPENRMTASKGQ